MQRATRIQVKTYKLEFLTKSGLLIISKSCEYAYKLDQFIYNTIPKPR